MFCCLLVFTVAAATFNGPVWFQFDFCFISSFGCIQQQKLVDHKETLWLRSIHTWLFEYWFGFGTKYTYTRATCLHSSFLVWWEGWTIDRRCHYRRLPVALPAFLHSNSYSNLDLSFVACHIYLSGCHSRHSNVNSTYWENNNNDNSCPGFHHFGGWTTEWLIKIWMNQEFRRIGFVFSCYFRCRCCCCCCCGWRVSRYSASFFFAIFKMTIHFIFFFSWRARSSRAKAPDLNWFL